MNKNLKKLILEISILIFSAVIAGIIVYHYGKIFDRKSNDSQIEYTITYHLNEGIGIENSSYTTTSETIFLPTEKTMKKDGFLFNGWYENKNSTGNAVINIPKGSSGNKEFWASWIKIPIQNFPCSQNEEIKKIISEAREIRSLSTDKSLDLFKKAHEMLCKEQKMDENTIRSIGKEDTGTQVNKYNNFFKSLNY